MDSRLELGPCAVDLLRQTATWPDRRVRLSSQESMLLAHLAASDGDVVSREELLVRVWGHPRDSLSRAVDKAVNRLRAKVEEDPADPRHLITVHGEGYRLVQGRAEPAAAAPGGGWPGAPGAFVGRGDELRELKELLRTARLVTITGLGGMGKTRLATELGREGVAAGFVDGAALPRATALPAAIAAALQLEVTGATPDAHLAQLISGARERDALVILDNLEHLGGVESLLARLLEECRGLRVLATSRSPIGLRGEAVFELGPLHRDAAAALLLSRARHLERDPAVPALVELLEGIPLALELAAASCTASTSSEFMADLQAGHRVLADGTPGRPARHRTLDAAIDGTWTLLAPREQGALARLTVFEGGFTRGAAARVLDCAPAEATELLGRFRDLGLLRGAVGPEGFRFSFFRCLRDRVLDHRQPDEGAARAHAQHFLDWSRAQMARAQGPEWQDALLQLRRERENLLAAAERSLPHAPAVATEIGLAIAPVAGVKGTAPAALLPLLERIPVAALPPALGRRLRVFLARARQWSLSPTDALRPFELLVAEARRADDLDALVGASLGRSRSLHRLGRDEDAARVLAEALEGMDDDPTRRGVLLVEQGVFLGRVGQASALPLLREGLALLEAAEASPHLPRSHSQFASAARRQGRMREAAAALETAAALRPPWDRRGRAADLGQLGLVLPFLGRYAEGLTALDEAVALELDLGRPAYAAQHEVNRALYCLAALDEQTAAVALRRARALSVRIDEPRITLQVDRCEVLVAALELRWEDARALCDDALELPLVKGRVVEESLWLGCAVPIRAFQGDLSGARELLRGYRAHEAAARFDEVRRYCVFLDVLLEALVSQAAEPDWSSAHAPIGLTGELTLSVSMPEVPIWMEAYARWVRMGGRTTGTP